MCVSHHFRYNIQSSISSEVFANSKHNNHRRLEYFYKNIIQSYSPSMLTTICLFNNQFIQFLIVGISRLLD